MTLASSGFHLFDPEFARLRDQVHEATGRLGRVIQLHQPGSLDYEVARLGFKQALKAMSDYARSGGQS